MKTIDETIEFKPKFDEKGLMPCITTHAQTGEVLMLAYMNEEALQKTLKSGEVHYWSRSRNELWHKGATSGHVQRVIEIRTDCDQDCLQIKVEAGPACHTGRKTCFYRKLNLENGSKEAQLEFIED